MSNSEIKLLLILMLPLIAFAVAEYLWYRRWVWKKSDLRLGARRTPKASLEMMHTRLCLLQARINELEAERDLQPTNDQPNNVISIRRGTKS